MTIIELLPYISSVIVALLSGLISYFAANKRSKQDLVILQEQNKQDLEKLMKQHVLDLKALERKHEMDIRFMEQDYEHKRELMQKEKELDLGVAIANMLSDGISKEAFSSPELKKEISDSVKRQFMSKKKK